MTSFNVDVKQAQFETIERRVEFGLETNTRLATFDVDGKIVQFGVPFQAGSLGEANDAANVGGGDAEVFRDKVGATLNFRTVSGLNGVLVAENGDVIEVSISPGTLDHSTLAGLGDDDHPQYHDGSLAYTGDLDMGANAIVNVGLVDGVDVSAHAARHENGGADEISVAGLSGLLADPQTPIAHAATHSDGGADEIDAGDLGSGGAGAGTVLTADGGGGAAWVANATTDELVGVTAADTTPGYLSAKVVAGNAIALAVLNGGADEDLEVSVDEAAISHLNIGDVGTNTHAQIDAHIASISNPHAVTLEQARLAGQVLVGTVNFDPGSVGALSLTLDSDLDSGFYSPSNNRIMVALAATDFWEFGTHFRGLSGTQAVRLQNGSASVPGYSFENFDTTGVYAAAGPALNYSVAGALQWSMTAGVLAGAGTRQIVAGTGAGEELQLRGTTNANLGLIRAQAPIVFDNVSAAVALSPYSIADTSTQTFTGAFIGGTFADTKTITFSNSTFVYETLRGSPDITSAVTPSFAAFTLFNALPILRAGASATHNPLQMLCLNIGGSTVHTGTGTRTSANVLGVSMRHTLQTVGGSGGTLNVTAYTGLQLLPAWNTGAGTTVNFGTVRGLWARTPAVALFGSSAGTEIMSAYYAVDVENIAFGGTVPKAAVRSAIPAATNAWFLLNNGGAASEFGGGIAHFNSNTPIQFGSSLNAADISQFWNLATSTFDTFFWSTSTALRWSSPAADRFILTTTNGNTVGQYNFNCLKFSLGAQTGAVGNQKGVFVAGAETVTLAGEFSQFLLTQAANDTINAALGLYAGWTINAPSPTIGTGSITTAAGLNVGGNPSVGTNRVGVRIISNPSGGGGVNAALWVTAGRSRFDGIVDINNGVALGGGAAATLGTIGGSGPTTAAQAQWVQIEINGVNHWIPAWT